MNLCKWIHRWAFHEQARFYGGSLSLAGSCSTNSLSRWVSEVGFAWCTLLSTRRWSALSPIWVVGNWSYFVYQFWRQDLSWFIFDYYVKHSDWNHYFLNLFLYNSGYSSEYIDDARSKCYQELYSFSQYHLEKAAWVDIRTMRFHSRNRCHSLCIWFDTDFWKWARSFGHTCRFRTGSLTIYPNYIRWYNCTSTEYFTFSPLPCQPAHPTTHPWQNIVHELESLQPFLDSILNLNLIWFGLSQPANFSKLDINGYYLMILILCLTINYLFYSLNTYLYLYPFSFEYPFSALIATMIFFLFFHTSTN